MVTSSIDSSLRAELSAVAESLGCELLEAAFEGGSLRLILDREEGGVTIDDCQSVSKQVSPLLDVHDFGDRKYVLEVSSPGLDRKLYGPRDYQRFQGHLTRVTFVGGPERTQRTVVGRLERYDDTASGGGALLLQEDDADRRHEIPVDDIKVARLEIEL